MLFCGIELQVLEYRVPVARKRVLFVVISVISVRWILAISSAAGLLVQDGEGNPEPCSKVMRELCERALDRHEEDEDPSQGIEEEQPDVIYDDHVKNDQGS